MGNLPANQTGFGALSSQQQEEHRFKIGVRAKAILSQFWTDANTEEAIQAIEIEGWCDVLENCSHSEVRNAWATYQKTGPRTQAGRLCKPDAGAIYANVMRSRPRPKLVRPEPEAPKGPRVTLDQMAQICAENDMDPASVGLKPFPKTGEGWD